MGDTPISALPLATALTGAELVPIVQSATTVQTTTGAFAGTSNIGYLGIPQNLQNVDYTLALADAGKHVYHTAAGSHTYTVPTNATVAFIVGTVITIALGGASGNVTVAAAGGVTLRQAGTTNTGNRTLAANAMVTLLKVAANEWMVNGVGIS